MEMPKEFITDSNDLDTVDIPDRDAELEELQATMLENSKQSAMNRAQKIVKKHDKEIKRLKTWAQKCVLENNYAGYVYSIKKLRGIYQIKGVDDIPALWASTQLELNNIIANASKGS